MGRQIGIVATEQDERDFLVFLRSTANIQIFEAFAPTIGELQVGSFATEKAGHYDYRIWNSAFPWTPEYEQTRKGRDKGLYYVSNSVVAPVIEFSRSGPGRDPGRIYWAKYFCAPSGPYYDVAEFEAWFNTIVRWVRKVGMRKKGLLEPYYLPNAANSR
jgi:hypothetical protein